MSWVIENWPWALSVALCTLIALMSLLKWQSYKGCPDYKEKFDPPAIWVASFFFGATIVASIILPLFPGDLTHQEAKYADLLMVGIIWCFYEMAWFAEDGVSWLWWKIGGYQTNYWAISFGRVTYHDRSHRINWLARLFNLVHDEYSGIKVRRNKDWVRLGEECREVHFKLVFTANAELTPQNFDEVCSRAESEWRDHLRSLLDRDASDEEITMEIGTFFNRYPVDVEAKIEHLSRYAVKYRPANLPSTW